jgi:hypothetical protein
MLQTSEMPICGLILWFQTIKYVFKYNVASDPTSIAYAHAPSYLPSIYIVRSSDTRWSPSVAYSGYSGFGLRILWCSQSGNHWENTLTKFGYLSLEEGSLFCFVVLRSTEPGDASDRVLGVSGKLSTRRGA